MGLHNHARRTPGDGVGGLCRVRLEHYVFGLGPVCMGGRQTVLDAAMTRTVTACAVGSDATEHARVRDEVKELCSRTYQCNGC